MVYDKKIAFAVIMAICFFAGYMVSSFRRAGEYSAIRASHERIKSELESAREELSEAEGIIAELEQGIINGKYIIDGVTDNIRRATDISGEIEDMDGSTRGALERIRSILGVGDGGRSADGDGPSAGASEQRPP
jgi:hypothetical protein